MNAEQSRLLCGTPELPPGCVALTFDDGPGPRSAELARLLRDEGVPGTFFCSARASSGMATCSAPTGTAAT